MVPKRLHARTGITLLEVLVAAVLLSVGVVALSAAISTSIQAGAQSDRRTTAARLAENVLARIESGEIPLDSSSEGDFLEDGEPDFGYSVTTEEGGEENLRKVTIEIVWEQRGRPSVFTVVKYIFDKAAVAEDPNAEEVAPE